MNLLKDPSGPQTEKMIELMDDYGLSREDVFETFDEFSMSAKESDKFASIDSKEKAAFTRTYNSTRFITI